MRLENYTPDLICKAVGLKGFVEDAWRVGEAPSIRVVLTPSFHPEIVITFNATDALWRLNVLSAKEQVWHLEGTRPVDVFDGGAIISVEALNEVKEAFHAAYKESQTLGRSVCCDGMGVEACLVTGSETLILKTNVAGTQWANIFVRGITKLAWEVIKHPEIRNSLAQASHYAGNEIPLIQIDANADLNRSARLLVLGIPEERKEFLKGVGQHKPIKR